MPSGANHRGDTPSLPPSPAPPASPLGLGIVGFGAIGQVHLAALAGRPDARVVAVSRRAAGAGGTPDLAGTPDLGATPAVDVHTDYRELLARPDVDVAVICTPSGDHADHISEALRCGKHVVVEKPLTIHPDDARGLAAEAERRGLLLAPISQRRFEPQNAELKQLVASGALGRPVLGEALVRWYRDDAYFAAADWRGTLDGDGGVLLNQGLHTIDLLCWFFGPRCTARGLTATLTHGIPAEDTAVAALRFESGALGVLAVTVSASPGVPEEINLFFDRGYARLRGSSIVDWEFDGVPVPGQLAEHRGSGASDPMAIGTAGHRAQWDDILSALLAGRKPAVTAADAITTLETIEEARRS